MSTRSLIGKFNKNGTVSHAFCHWDGYPEYNGQILLNHYTDIAKLDQLLRWRNISSLGTTPDPINSKEIADYKARIKDENNFYVHTDFRGGDKQEEQTPYISKDIDAYMCEDAGQEFSYLLYNGKWYVQDLWNNQDRFFLLSDVLAKTPNPTQLDIVKLRNINSKTKKK